MNWRIVALHLGILFGYCALILLLTFHGGEELFGRAILSLFAVGMHALILLVLVISGRSKAHLLSALLVVLIGWSFCTSTFTL